MHQFEVEGACGALDHGEHWVARKTPDTWIDWGAASAVEVENWWTVDLFGLVWICQIFHDFVNPEAATNHHLGLPLDGRSETLSSDEIHR